MYLLDTHALLWFLDKSENLSKKAFDAIISYEKTFVSMATIWEIAIKQSIRKLDIQCSSSELVALCVQEHFEIMPISETHIDAIRDMPFIHHDPFDRLLIAQAQTEDVVIITKDEKIKKYPVKTLW